MPTTTLIDYGAAYPRRPKFFFGDFLRLIDRLAVIQEVGNLGFAILVHVVLTEDRRRYQGPPKFYKAGLADRLGVAQVETISAAIDRCVKAGWLHWEKPRRPDGSERVRCQGVAWVTIPVWADDSGDRDADRPEKPVKQDDRPENPVNDPVYHPVNDPVYDPVYHSVNDPVPPYHSPSHPKPAPATITKTELADSDPWEAAAAAVRNELTDWRKPLDACRRAGLTPDDVLALIAVWRSEQGHLEKPLGALHYALRHAEPRHRGQWAELLPLKDAVLRERRRASRAAVAAADPPARVDHSRESRLRQLEFDWTPRLAGLAVSDIVARFSVPPAIAARLEQYGASRWTKGLRMNEAVKLDLLEFLNQERNHARN